MFSFENCTDDLPTAKEMLQVMTMATYSKSMLIFTTILAGLTLVIFTEITIYVSMKVPYGAQRGYTIYLLGHFPVFTLTSLASIYIPRAAVVASWAASIYLSLGLYIFILLILAHYRGIDTMVRRLTGEEISLAQPPLACCCPCCCTKIKLTHINIHRLRLVVLQGAVIQPLTLFLASILWTDGIYIPSQISASSAFLYLTVISLISTMIGVYGLTVLYKVSAVQLKKYWVREKFMALKIVMILPNVQTLILAILVRAQVITCQPPLNAALLSNAIYNGLIVIEMFIMIAAARFVIYKLRQRNLRRRASSLDDVLDVESGHGYQLVETPRKIPPEPIAPEGSRIIRHIETDV